MKKSLVIVLVVAALMAGCNKGNEGKAIMKVGKEVITEKDLTNALEQLPEQYKEYYSSEDGKKQLLERIAEQKMLAMEAKGMGLEKTEDFKIKMEQAKDMALAQLAVKKNIVDGVKATDADIKAEYEKNKQNYKMDEEVKASHILIKVDTGMTPAQKQEARAKASDILKQVTEGKDFAELAKQHSASPEGAQNGGDLGWFSKERMVAPFSEAAFAGEEGKVIPNLVETQFGYHIIKVTGKRPAGFKPIEDVRKQIEEQLLGDLRNKKYESWKEEMKKKYKTEEVKDNKPAETEKKDNKESNEKK
jgi:peptidyl-prolyl cis-trans isomerase C